jgi:phosphatidylinositol alpha-1,6-mannosyltransferase
MNKPLITLVTPDYPPARGGVARYLSNLVRAAQGRINVVAPENFEFFWRMWPKWWPLVGLCREQGVSGRLVLVSHVFPVGTAAWLSRLLGGAEYAVIFHGLDLRLVKGTWKRWLFRRITERAKLLIVNSRSTEKDLLLLAPTARPLILTPGVEAAPPVSREQARSKLNLSSDSQIVLSVARLVPRKGIDVALRAMSLLNFELRTSNFEYVVVGDGPDLERLQNVARDLGINVRWIRHAEDEEKWLWLAAADVFLLPVRDVGDDVEGFGIVFLEAGRVGVPVVAGKSGGAIEAVQAGETGLLIDPHDVEQIAQVVKTLLQNPTYARDMGAKAQKRVQADFDWNSRWHLLEENLGYGLQASGCGTSDKLAVVIPCFNHADVLRRTLENICHQTRSIDELVIVDDGSTDHPELVVKEFVSRLPIKFIRLAENRGAPYARNLGARETTAPMILFLDADAEFVPDALRTLTSALEAQADADFVYSNFFWGAKRFRGQPFDFEALKQRNFIHTSSLIRRGAFPGFDESLKKFQDWDLWLTMARRGSRGVWIDRELYRIQPRREGMSRWLPRAAFWIPWSRLGFVPKDLTKYREAEEIVRKKHGI